VYVGKLELYASPTFLTHGCSCLLPSLTHLDRVNTVSFCLGVVLKCISIRNSCHWPVQIFVMT